MATFFFHIIQSKTFQLSPPSKSSLFSTKKEEHPLPKTSLSQSIFLIFSCYFPFLRLPNPLLHLPQHILRGHPFAHLHHSHNDHHLVVEVVFEFSLVGLEIFHEF